MPIVIRIDSGASRPRFLRIPQANEGSEICLGEDARGRIVTKDPARPYLFIRFEGTVVRIRPALRGFKVNGESGKTDVVVLPADRLSLRDMTIRIIAIGAGRSEVQ